MFYLSHFKLKAKFTTLSLDHQSVQYINLMAKKNGDLSLDFEDN